MIKIKKRLSTKTTQIIELAMKYQQAGHLQEAEDIYRKILQEQPNNFQLYSNMGFILQTKGRIDEAITYYLKALERNPHDAIVYYNIGNAFHEKGEIKSAITNYQRSIQLNPLPKAYNNLGSAFVQMGQFDEAITSFQKAVQSNPHYVHAYYNLGTALREQSKPDEAIAAYDEAIRIDPNNMAAHLARCISQLPLIYSDQASIKIYRNRYSLELQNLVDAIDLKNPQHIEAAAMAIGSQQPFYLAYQGCNDRDLQYRYGNLVCRIMASRYPQFSARPAMPHRSEGETLKVGIVSGFFYRHSVWKVIVKGWMENLDRNRFSLLGYYTGKTKDDETEAARKYCTRFVEGVSSFEKLAGIIRGDHLHLLIYPEIGMDSMTVKLASLWLAPIQCVSWGHPETSGLPTIDYFISGELLEPPEADSHYTENLIRLPNLSIYYSPQVKSSTKVDRDIFGLRHGDVIYQCCQSPFKFLPQYDEVYPRIAREVGNCQFLFITLNSSVAEQFRLRIDHVFERFHLNADEFVVWLPYLDQARYEALNRICDVFLDPIEWSGCTSTLEAIDCNLPVVVLPGSLMRGRESGAILTMMGVQETIAHTVDEYIEIAIKLGNDRDWRKNISSRIENTKHRIYGDKACIKALETFMNKIVKEQL
ncbi:MAG: tetratricopeptide repeat protein [Thermodesulfovibrionales bacterium]|nr:tetratricopeptide repeat protein [Thermodesulfovibrionales bacterium]